MTQQSFVGGIEKTPQVMLTPEQLAAWYALRNQDRCTNWPYYSRVRFRLVRAAGIEYVLEKGTTVQAFGYGLGSTKEVAGFLASDGPATHADTNILEKQKTIGPQNVLIHGIAFLAMPAAFTVEAPNTDPIFRPMEHALVSAIAANVSWRIDFNGGENKYELGNFLMNPGAAGLLGGNEQLLRGFNLAGDPASAPHASNGWPVFTNRFPIPAGMVWRKTSDQDSAMSIIGTTEQKIRLVAGGSVENIIAADQVANNDPVAVATGERGFVFPQQIIQDFVIFLDNEVIGRRSDIT